MTRDFSKQGRDDERPSSPNSSSGRYGEERSPRPARPRLNRAAVDRAWENGAPQNHADYRTRRNNSNYRNGQPPRDSRRRDAQFDHPSAQNSRNSYGSQRSYGSRSNDRPLDNRQDNNRPTERTPYGNQNPRYRTTDSGTRNFDNPRFNDRREGGYSARPGETGSHPRFSDNARYRDQGDRYHDPNAGRGYGQQGRDLNRRDSRDFDRDNRPPRNFDRGNRPSPSRGVRGPDTQNPRWQSRPAMQRGNAYPGQGQTFPRNRSQEEQFEGDYERFEAPDASQHPSTPGQFQDNLPGRPGQAPNEPSQRPVTRLPDGRVLKGPRPAQRKNAQFWNEISDQAEALVDPVQTSPAEQPAQPTHAAPVKPVKPEAPPRSSTPRSTRTHTSSAVTRGRKARTGEAGTKKRISKPRSSGPRPSQRGYKWPTQ